MIYYDHFTLNSFPSEYFTLSEQKAFAEYFGRMDGLGVDLFPGYFLARPA